ncbi:uncharacterized protein M6B38_150660 [Iris pallida]|uniref:FLZ-type domain-containing protein n=1 Tax=Iris pallida TaxID=29817 RepID=A0AAX6F6C6_IRIPA|nr:uncharacterized protein M6B38_198755 [Iris pallida]KAJ6811778.1 uncharacterized protein M6B38_150660 [Iris pallida]
MLVGKRPRPQLSRTTSMTRFEPDVVVDPMEIVESPLPSDHQEPQNDWLGSIHVSRGVGGVMSPRSSSRTNHRRSSVDFAANETAPFLKNCGLCSRRLRTGKDIYMYRGEIAFCSLECREQRIANDEWLEKRALSAAIKAETAAATAAGGSEASGSGEIVAIA